MSVRASGQKNGRVRSNASMDIWETADSSTLDEPHNPWSVSLTKSKTVDERPVCSAVIVVCRVPESTEVYTSKRIEDVATSGKSMIF